MSGLEAGEEPANEALMKLLYYLVGFIMVMAAPIVVILMYGSASPQLLTFSFILYAILAGIIEGLSNSPIIPASIDVALVLIVISNYASLHSISSQIRLQPVPLAVIERYGGHSVIAPDFSQIALLALLIIHRKQLARLSSTIKQRILGRIHGSKEI